LPRPPLTPPSKKELAIRQRNAAHWAWVAEAARLRQGAAEASKVEASKAEEDDADADALLHPWPQLVECWVCGQHTFDRVNGCCHNSTCFWSYPASSKA
jgi:hypothetical protein